MAVGSTAANARMGAADERLWRSALTAPARNSWIRVEVTDAKGRLLLLSNPVYLQ